MSAPSTTEIKVRMGGAPDVIALRLKPVGLMAAERTWGGGAFEEHPIEATLKAAWVSAGMPGGKDGFDDWAANINEIVTEEEAGEPDPSSATPADPSPPSQ